MKNNEKSEFEAAFMNIGGENPFDFEKVTPPILDEQTLRQESERRALIKQIRVLRIASILMALCLALFAFYIAPKSLFIAIVSITILCVSMIGYGLITILFYKNGYNSIEL
ncbi:MAG: hypothetical protein NC110_05145 [Ruminococcus sp.]|nr:hypothetical protein [Ruminococcus sp.]